MKYTIVLMKYTKYIRGSKLFDRTRNGRMDRTSNTIPFLVFE